MVVLQPMMNYKRLGALQVGEKALPKALQSLASLATAVSLTAFSFCFCDCCAAGTGSRTHAQHQLDRPAA